DTVQNRLRDFFSILRQYRGVISRERVYLEPILSNARPTEVFVVPRLFLVDEQGNAPCIFFGRVTVQQTPVTDFGLIKAVILDRFCGRRDLQLATRQVANHLGPGPTARADDFGENPRDMQDSPPYEMKISQKGTDGGWPLGIE